MAREILKADVGMFPKKFNPKISNRYAASIGNAFQQAIVEIPLLPRYGNPGEVLVKTSSNDYDVEWSIPLASQNIYNANGVLTGHRILDGAGNYTLRMIGLFNYHLEVSDDMYIRYPIGNNVVGARLVLIDPISGLVEWKKEDYDLPQDDGTEGQILFTDGNGVVDWRNDYEYVSIQEISASEPCEIKLGDALWAAPPTFAGLKLVNITASVAQDAVDNMSFNVIVGGTTYPLTLPANNTTITSSFFPQTMIGGDTGVINITSVGAFKPKGLTVVLTFQK